MTSQPVHYILMHGTLRCVPCNRVSPPCVEPQRPLRCTLVTTGGKPWRRRDLQTDQRFLMFWNAVSGGEAGRRRVDGLQLRWSVFPCFGSHEGQQLMQWSALTLIPERSAAMSRVFARPRPVAWIYCNIVIADPFCKAGGWAVAWRFVRVYPLSCGSALQSLVS